MKEDLEVATSGRRDFLKSVVLGTIALGAATTHFGDVEGRSLGAAQVSLIDTLVEQGASVAP